MSGTTTSLAYKPLPQDAQGEGDIITPPRKVKHTVRACKAGREKGRAVDGKAVLLAEAER